MISFYCVLPQACHCSVWVRVNLVLSTLPLMPLPEVVMKRTGWGCGRLKVPSPPGKKCYILKRSY